MQKVLFQKQVVSQLARKSSSLYAIWKFITTFTTDHQWSLP